MTPEPCGTQTRRRTRPARRPGDQGASQQRASRRQGRYLPAAGNEGTLKLMITMTATDVTDGKSHEANGCSAAQRDGPRDPRRGGRFTGLAPGRHSYERVKVGPYSQVGKGARLWEARRDRFRCADWRAGERLCGYPDRRRPGVPDQTRVRRKLAPSIEDPLRQRWTRGQILGSPRARRRRGLSRRALCGLVMSDYRLPLLSRRYSTAARISCPSHVVQSSFAGSPATPVSRPTATILDD